MECPSWAPERGHVLRCPSWRSGLFAGVGAAGAAAERGGDLNELVPWVLARRTVVRASPLSLNRHCRADFERQPRKSLRIAVVHGLR
jgi:hypothetical protein